VGERGAYPRLSVEEAQERVLARFGPLAPERVPVLDGLGRVLAEDIVADMDVPPLDNSAMDGYAVRSDDIGGASRDRPARLRVVAELAAGRVGERGVGRGEAARIMTGAPLPPGADTVVRFEETRWGEDFVEILNSVPRGRNVRRAGEDVRKGRVVLPQGTVLRPQEIGMLASLGRPEALVIRRPRVGILATGDEIVGITDEVGPGQIRNINGYSTAAQVLKHGGLPVLLGCAPDRAAELAAKLQEGIAARVDLFVTSGGVSVGDYDLVKDVLATAGLIEFWAINMQPGRPMAFGTIGGTPLLGLPGNPVAAMVSFELFARPAIRKMLGYPDWEWRSVEARLRTTIERNDAYRHYLRVRLRPGQDGLEAELTGDQGSGILRSLVLADGLAVIPEASGPLAAGTRVRVLVLD